jgi:oxygen-independent coproporphyrinogen-3 oxidase
VLSPQERLEEALFTGLRLTAGVDVEGMKKRYDADIWALYGEELQPFVDQGLVIYDGRRVRLTRAGMLLANEIMAVFIGPAVR